MSEHQLAAGLLIGALLLASGAVAAWLTISDPGPTVLTARVERRSLDGSVTAPGTVEAGQTVQVAPLTQDRGDTVRAVVTGLPVRTGELVAAGRVLVEISGRPVFALPGGLPAYRDLKPGAQGRDVSQLQKALHGLGFPTGSDKDADFGAGTAVALTALYSSRGYTPLPAQPDGAMLRAAAEDAVASARRAWQDDRETLRAARARAVLAKAAADGGSGSAAAERAAAQQAVQAAERQVARSGEDLAAARRRLAEAKTANGPMLPVAEVLYLKGFPATVDSVAASVGSVVTRSAMTVSGDGLVIRSGLPGYARGLVQPGQTVRIVSETGRVSASGTVASVADAPVQMQPVGAVAGTASPGGAAAGDAVPGGAVAPGGPGYPMVVRPDHELDPGLAARAVLVTVQTPPSRGRVLAVPTAALSTGPDGSTTVVVYRGGARRRTDVLTGATGGGWTEIRPLDDDVVGEGDRVVVDANPGSGGNGGVPSPANSGPVPAARPAASPATPGTVHGRPARTAGHGA
ncbi:peptidoglycan-binding protein [Peterkaempfera sp. SMS 1(5)a]|uniref:peptidoglycan-binding protein n=1 Tax=Peterkaempfera podocarpi TaxID=3232308 RepID=UPI00366C0784